MNCNKLLEGLKFDGLENKERLGLETQFVLQPKCSQQQFYFRLIRRRSMVLVNILVVRDDSTKINSTCKHTCAS